MIGADGNWAGKAEGIMNIDLVRCPDCGGDGETIICLDGAGSYDIDDWEQLDRCGFRFNPYNVRAYARKCQRCRGRGEVLSVRVAGD
jgi:hypothetical protein